MLPSGEGAPKLPFPWHYFHRLLNFQRRLFFFPFPDLLPFPRVFVFAFSVARRKIIIAGARTYFISFAFSGNLPTINFLCGNGNDIFEGDRGNLQNLTFHLF